MPFQKGQSGNPNGRRSTKDFERELRSALKKADGDADKLRKVAETLISKAIDGDMAAIGMIADRIDGKVPQQIGGDPENPLALRIEEIRRTIVDPQHSDSAGVRPAPEAG